jgi:hypothetical protein
MWHQNDAPNECARVIYHPRCAQNAFGSTQTPAALNHTEEHQPHRGSEQSHFLQNLTWSLINRINLSLFSHVREIEKKGLISEMSENDAINMVLTEIYCVLRLTSRLIFPKFFVEKNIKFMLFPPVSLLFFNSRKNFEGKTVLTKKWSF